MSKILLFAILVTSVAMGAGFLLDGFQGAITAGLIVNAICQIAIFVFLC